MHNFLCLSVDSLTSSPDICAQNNLKITLFCRIKLLYNVMGLKSPHVALMIQVSGGDVPVGGRADRVLPGRPAQAGRRHRRAAAHHLHWCAAARSRSQWLLAFKRMHMFFCLTFHVRLLQLHDWSDAIYEPSRPSNCVVLTPFMLRCESCSNPKPLLSRNASAQARHSDKQTL